MTTPPSATKTQSSASQVIESDALIDRPATVENLTPSIADDAAHARTFFWAWPSVAAGAALGVVAIGSIIWAYRRRPRRLAAP